LQESKILLTQPDITVYTVSKKCQLPLQLQL